MITSAASAGITTASRIRAAGGHTFTTLLRGEEDVGGGGVGALDQDGLHQRKRQVGVSAVTVSRALRQPGMVSAALRARVDAAVMVIGYDLVADKLE